MPTILLPENTLIVFGIDYDDCVSRKPDQTNLNSYLNNFREQEKINIIAEFREETGCDPTQEIIQACLDNTPSLSPETITAYRNAYLLQHNTPLTNEIKKYPKHISHVTIFSNRQSHSIDQANKKKSFLNTGSCFNFIPALATACGIRFTPMLLADLFGQDTLGTAFWRATDPGYEGTHARTPLDTNKVLITYAQAHYFATTYPDKQIIYKIYDDNCTLRNPPSTILDNLRDYFKKYPALLPKNVTFELNHYEGGKITCFDTLQGTGEADPDYAKTVRMMTALALDKTPDYCWHADSHAKHTINVTSISEAEIRYALSTPYGTLRFFSPPTNPNLELQDLPSTLLPNGSFVLE